MTYKISLPQLKESDAIASDLSKSKPRNLNNKIFGFSLRHPFTRNTYRLIRSCNINKISAFCEITAQFWKLFDTKNSIMIMDGCIRSCETITSVAIFVHATIYPTKLSLFSTQILISSWGKNLKWYAWIKKGVLQFYFEWAWYFYRQTIIILPLKYMKHTILLVYLGLFLV